ncbi:phosphate/phosphite/phosphonate ABC transporter substrate-binding protein [Dissulfurirhabdus thermomarina]|uniref:Phosphate/phosphite/phosphonate ABC transporter substrate-binding protein n=1 Tax=Dissulfurirhabdus thermomarina TaxID=1765737 RepID=A0A6N9TTZ9_DISTH|nr:phosphate/phosphite/phosphonate ABC transporter substrate-binding protein [Dissulfurirhabdus thermomarina]NDY41976.1 phosphate/phosphite/phosphonate ABC transporter substrate-binding protein [Dissulfurirhabdus thermomarina]NMX22801.1 phosphate/phosphite/phosphonate ABC transporter substrate-binding protein [Dissulfurirhabdus thermomarina]
MKGKMFIRLVAWFAVLGLAPLSAPAGAHAAMKIGVLAKRGNVVAMKKWKPLADYLTKETGTPFEVVPLNFEEIEPSVSGGRIDYLIANSGFYVDMHEKYGVKALASLLNMREGRALNRFGGVIFTRAGSSIRSLADLRGTRFMCVKRTSFGGGQMAFRHLIEHGINPFRDFTLVEGKKHDNVVYAVKNGVMDAGTVRSDTLERMEAEGKIRMGEFRVIDPAHDGFPFVHTTILYPEWPFAALAKTPADLNRRVTRALLSLKEGHPAAKAAKIAGWTAPLDYGPVAECLRIVREHEK